MGNSGYRSFWAYGSKNSKTPKKKVIPNLCSFRRGGEIHRARGHTSRSLGAPMNRARPRGSHEWDPYGVKARIRPCPQDDTIKQEPYYTAPIARFR